MPIGLILSLLLPGGIALIVALRRKENRWKRGLRAFGISLAGLWAATALFLYLIQDMNGTEAFGFITLLLSIGVAFISVLVGVRQYRKHPERETVSRFFYSIGAFILMEILITAVLFPFWVWLGFATYNPHATAMVPTPVAMVEEASPAGVGYQQDRWPMV